MTPDHYVIAEQLMQRVTDTGNPTIPISRELTQQAIAHALLAQAQALRCDACPLGEHLADNAAAVETRCAASEQL